jgi:hypothetical protein
MDRIPERYIRYRAFSAALLCWALYGSVFAACLVGSALGIADGGLTDPGFRGLNMAETITATFLVLLVIEALVYLVFLRRRFARMRAEALQDAAAGIDDPALLAGMARVPQGSAEYHELVIQGYQDFVVGLGYTTVFLFFPGLFIGLFLAIPLSLPLAAIESLTALPEGFALLLSLFLGQVIAAPLWYKLGFYRFFRRGRIKSLMRGRGVDIKAPRPGLYKRREERERGED